MAPKHSAIDVSRSQIRARDQRASGRDSPLSAQRDYWTAWNGSYVEQQRGPISQRQAQVVEGWLRALASRSLDILEVGCGTGWLVQRMLPFGLVTATDLSAAVLPIAQQKCPTARFVAGDFLTLDLAHRSYDVVVSLEVLAHVADPAAFFERIADLLKPGGHVMIATQNRPVLERCEDVAPRGEGQIRNWVDRHQLRALMQPRFRIDEMMSICPHGHGGFLRAVNSPKLNRLLSSLVGRARVDAVKERFWLGHTLMARATVRG